MEITTDMTTTTLLRPSAHFRDADGLNYALATYCDIVAVRVPASLLRESERGTSVLIPRPEFLAGRPSFLPENIWRAACRVANVPRPFYGNGAPGSLQALLAEPGHLERYLIMEGEA